MPKPLSPRNDVPTGSQTWSGLSTSVEFRLPVAVGMPGVPLATPPASSHRPAGVAADHGGVVGAIDGDGDQLLGAVDRGGGERVGQRLPGVECLHQGVAVVERVGPHAGRRQRVVAEAVVARCRRADRRPVRRIVDVGGIQIPGRGGYARRAVGDTAGFEHRPGDIAADHRGVVGAMDGDGHHLLRCRRPSWP